MAPVGITAYHLISGGFAMFQWRINQGILAILKRYPWIARLLAPIRPAPIHHVLQPQTSLYQMFLGCYQTQLIYVAATLGIADLLKDGPKSIAELAVLSGSREDELYRVMRALASLGIFTEQKQKSFKMNSLSACLQSDIPGSLRSAAIYMGCAWHWLPMGAVLERVKRGVPAFEHIHGSGFYNYLSQHSRARALYANAMSAFSHQSHILAAYAYGFEGTKRLVDVGGGLGVLLQAILERFNHLEGVLFDLPEIAVQARHRFKKMEALQRVSFVEGDFFKSVPRAGDSYMLSMILVDYEDEEVIQILKNIRSVIPSEGKLIVLEMVVNRRNAPSFAKLAELELLVNNQGRMRSANEFKACFQKAGFRLSRICSSVAPVSVVEGIPC